MRKWIALLLALALCLGLCACGGKDKTTDAEEQNAIVATDGDLQPITDDVTATYGDLQPVTETLTPTDGDLVPIDGN